MGNIRYWSAFLTLNQFIEFLFFSSKPSVMGAFKTSILEWIESVVEQWAAKVRPFLKN